MERLYIDYVRLLMEGDCHGIVKMCERDNVLYTILRGGGVM
jgi:hypothetical protein